MRRRGLALLCLAFLMGAPAAVWGQADARKGFHGNPLKKDAQPESLEVDEGLREYREILHSRCLQCHSAERIDEAIRGRLSFESVEEILLRRNVVLSKRERNVLGTFWGNPLKGKPME